MYSRRARKCQFNYIKMIVLNSGGCNRACDSEISTLARYNLEQIGSFNAAISRAIRGKSKIKRDFAQAITRHSSSSECNAGAIIVRSGRNRWQLQPRQTRIVSIHLLPPLSPVCAPARRNITS